MREQRPWVEPSWIFNPPGEKSWERDKRRIEEYIAEHGLAHYSEWDYEEDD